jgi:hypothetical protein
MHVDVCFFKMLSVSCIITIAEHMQAAQPKHRHIIMMDSDLRGVPL